MRRLLWLLLLLPLMWLVRLPARSVHPYLSQFSSDVLVMAHQGGDRLWPSNTLFAFEHAAALGVDVLELDVHTTRDGVLVVIHDDTVDRTTDGTGAVIDLTLAELKALDAGYTWSPERQGGTYPYRGLGITVPTLAEVFEAFPTYPINIEIKQETPDISGALCNELRTYNKQMEVMVVSFYSAAIRDFRERCPEVATAAAPGELRTFFILHKLRLSGLYRSPAEAVQVPEVQGNFRLVTLGFVRAAHARGIAVHVWTVDEVDAMQRLTALAVDGIMSDRPDRLLRVLGRGQVVERPVGVPE